MKPFETVKRKNGRSLAFADDVGENTNKLLFAKNRFNKTIYNYRKLFSIFIWLDLQVVKPIELVHSNNLGVY